MSSLCLNLTQISDCCTEPCKRSAIEVLILKYDKIALALATFLICDFGCTFEALSDPSPSGYAKSYTTIPYTVQIHSIRILFGVYLLSSREESWERE